MIYGSFGRVLPESTKQYLARMLGHWAFARKSQHMLTDRNFIQLPVIVIGMV